MSPPVRLPSISTPLRPTLRRSESSPNLGSATPSHTKETSKPRDTEQVASAPRPMPVPPQGAARTKDDLQVGSSTSVPKLEGTPRYGIEIEFKGISYEKAAQVVATALRGTVEKVDSSNYRVYDQTGRVWQIKPDVGCTELATPILEGRDDLELLKAVAAELEAEGARPGRGTGMHMHIDARDFTNAQIATFVGLAEEHGDTLQQALRIPNERLKFCAPTLPGATAALSAGNPVDRDELRQAFLLGVGITRYRLLNVMNIFYGDKNTFELRGFNSTLRGDTLEYNWELGMRMAKQALSATDFPARPTVRSGDALPALLAALNIKPEDGLARFLASEQMKAPVGTNTLSSQALGFYQELVQDANSGNITNAKQSLSKFLAMPPDVTAPLLDRFVARHMPQFLIEPVLRYLVAERSEESIVSLYTMANVVPTQTLRIMRALARHPFEQSIVYLLDLAMQNSAQEDLVKVALDATAKRIPDDACQAFFNVGKAAPELWPTLIPRIAKIKGPEALETLRRIAREEPEHADLANAAIQSRKTYASAKGKSRRAAFG